MVLYDLLKSAVFWSIVGCPGDVGSVGDIGDPGGSFGDSEMNNATPTIVINMVANTATPITLQ